MTTSIVTLLIEHDDSHGDPETWNWQRRGWPGTEIRVLGRVAAPRRATSSYANAEEVCVKATPGSVLVAADGEWMIYLDAGDKAAPFAAPDSPDLGSGYRWISARDVAWPLTLEWSPDDRAD